jgi:hypothetical protein
LYNNYSSDPVYSNFSTGGIEIMNGIKVFKDTVQNKPMIAYNSPIKASEIMLGIGELGGTDYPIYGLGLKKETSGNISPAGTDPISIHGGWYYNSVDYGNVSFSAYKSFLEDAGLYLLINDVGNMVVNHSDIEIASTGADANVVSNGIYDFILSYYNPSASGATEADNAGKDLLPRWSSSLGAKFDGLSAGSGSARNVGGTDMTNSLRKVAATGKTGEPNNDFKGNITIPMVVYMSNNGVTEFANTNILGNYDQCPLISFKGLTSTPTRNIGLIGDYYDMSASLTGSLKKSGVLDIVGTLPERIGRNNSADMKVLNIWNDVTRETNIQRVPVAFVKGNGAVNIATGATAGDNNDGNADVIVYSNKYIGTPDSTLKPHHRAFMVGDTPKFTGDIGSDDYKGSSPNSAIPSLDESAWIDYANNGGTPPANLASSYADLSADRKITESEFASLQTALIPADSPAHMVWTPRRTLEAILPNLGNRKEYGA